MYKFKFNIVMDVIYSIMNYVVLRMAVLTLGQKLYSEM
jgi:hypothetical protein